MKEGEVVKKINSDEQSKLSKLYQLYEQLLYRVAFSILHDSGLAEDVTHDTFVRIASKLSVIGDCESEETKYYIIKVAKNIAIDRYRRQKNEANYVDRHTEIESLNHVGLDRRDGMEDKIIEKYNLTYLLSKLDSVSREIIKLRCFQELSYCEIGKRLEINESTAMKRFQRAKQKMQEMKGAYEYEQESSDRRY